MSEALKIKKKPSSINATPEVADFISRLEKGDNLDKIINRAKRKLLGDMCAGELVQKKKIPKHYIRKYQLNNLYVLDLDSGRRLTYTLIFNGVGISVNIIEIFLNHKEYAKRFGYS